jgi:putative sigma-54 modulation protein
MIVGVASSADVTMALRDALERTEKQAIRLKKKKIQVHRQSKEKTDAKAQSALLKRNNTVKQSGPPVPEDGTALELHVLPSKESVARHAMSIHEAVKEAAYRDRDVFVFRDNNGEIKVLHRTREGIVQLIEVP